MFHITWSYLQKGQIIQIPTVVVWKHCPDPYPWYLPILVAIKTSVKSPVLPTRFIVCKHVPVMNIGKILLTLCWTTVNQSANIIWCNFFRFLSAKKQLRNISGVRYGIAIIVFLLLVITITECTYTVHM